ncbi:MAG: GNAT family N-acetyltransferase [Deltaproteobacteria bacterium]|nr:GNAT family N-acetyltransferase [Deltaproteobacteria bacterium]MBW2359694.1 GNAT family N-acetyltransferase [Deltaproteobacteria bacterium]
MIPATRRPVEPERDAVLGNPVWHALRGTQRALAVSARGGRALRYHPEVNIFSAADQLEEADWAALAELVGAGGVAILSRDVVPAAPTGWLEVYRGTGVQLVAGNLANASAPALEELSAADVPEMIELVRLTVPGPFLPRTHELGTYVGVRREGQLVAMAGERMRVPGHAEISAVCTHPSARRQGLATALTLGLAREIRSRGDEAFLHVAAENESALRLYQSLGFEVRRPVEVVAARFEG